MEHLDPQGGDLTLIKPIDFVQRRRYIIQNVKLFTQAAPDQLKKEQKKNKMSIVHLENVI